MQQGARAREGQSRTLGDEQRLICCRRRSELTGDDGAGRRRQSLLQMFLFLNEDQVTRLGLSDAGNVRDFEVAVADQASSYKFRQSLQGLGHEGVIAADSG